MRHFFIALFVPFFATAGCTGKVVLGDITALSDAAPPVAPIDGGPPVTPDASPVHPTPHDSGPGETACFAKAGAAHTFTTIADVKAALAGTWLLCSGQINAPPNAAGIEFSGTKAYYLVLGANNALERNTSTEYERDVTILDVTSMNGPGSYQINLDKAGGGGNSYFADYTDAPHKLRLNENTSGKTADYSRESSCKTKNPGGCISAGCGAGETCSRTAPSCTPSACGCDESSGNWRCTADCGGGVCVSSSADAGTD